MGAGTQYKYVEKVKDRHGTTRFYLRLNRRQKRISLPTPITPAAPGAAFVQAYELAMQKAQAAAAPHVAKHPERVGTIYVLALSGMVKIGFSINFKARFRNLKTAFPDIPTVVATLKGTRQHEAQLHRNFKPYKARKGSEWFRIEGELKTWLENPVLIKPRVSSHVPVR